MAPPECRVYELFDIRLTILWPQDTVKLLADLNPWARIVQSLKGWKARIGSVKVRVLETPKTVWVKCIFHHSIQFFSSLPIQFGLDNSKSKQAFSGAVRGILLEVGSFIIEAFKGLLADSRLKISPRSTQLKLHQKQLQSSCRYSRDLGNEKSNWAASLFASLLNNSFSSPD